MKIWEKDITPSRFTPEDRAFLQKALELAVAGLGYVSPNPMVGAVVVKDGEIVGTGYHRQFGGDHAEVEALREAGHLSRGATLYCTLEPCSHFGKTPPCVNRVIESGVVRVVIGTMDPNPLVNGRGANMLREHGIAVESGLLEEACYELNESYFKFITTRLPFVTLKVAQSLDGKIADAAGHSRWISNEQARRLVHRWRWQNDAIMVGIGTVLADDPQLTVREEPGQQPRRIIVDTNLRLPLSAKLLNDEHVAKIIVAIGENCRERDKIAEIENRGARVWSIHTSAAGSLDMRHLMERIGQEGIASLFVEGGRRIFSSLLEGRFADRLKCFIAPKLLGDGIPAFQGLPIHSMSQAILLEKTRWETIGDNVLVSGIIRYSQ
ncbi:bifunctional diaminohydroxyphosphoribosylaminopyrimidine deaminase/5-amino-6-(5-phosphoribosylamino)uracil reductase RibD [candidate division KSB1 bacterium]|nr:bifunctional diaminohydroxyphosphoribosylaminopyrimidine deaminase/5-amino-6-(5-phosphoribosylamino)uracil reductase RibD [candidate division KSB1 bacterium]